MAERKHENLYRHGAIEVICGSMFSGKTEELIRRVTRAQIARLKIQVFKPVVDNRYSTDHVASHSALRLKSERVIFAAQIIEKLNPKTQVVAIDEAQFFDAQIIEVCQKLADLGKRVIVAGLDQDFKGMPFEPMPQLMAVAEYVTKCNAICVICGGLASRTQRLHPSQTRVEVGAAEAYEARCRFCHEVLVKTEELPETPPPP